jgi:ABC-2 type transport system permease protein
VTRLARVRAAAVADWRSFLRRRTAVFFTFFFPLMLVVIFGALVRTEPGGGGLFTEPAAYYVPGYLALVVIFTPLSRLGSEVARHRDRGRFEKLATTPLSPAEWLLAQTVVAVAVVGLAAVAVLVLVIVLTGATVVPSPLLVPYLVAGIVTFCGVGAVLGAVADSQDGAIAFSNALALPLLFLSETFVPPALLPEWVGTLAALSPVTYFSRGVRAATRAGGGDALANLAVVVAVAVVAFVVGAAAVPWQS